MSTAVRKTQGDATDRGGLRVTSWGWRVQTGTAEGPHGHSDEETLSILQDAEFTDRIQSRRGQSPVEAVAFEDFIDTLDD